MGPGQGWLANSQYFGVTAPTLIWWASAALTVWASYAAASLYTHIVRAARPLRAAARGLQVLAQELSRSPGAGVSAQAYQRVRDTLTGSGAAWSLAPLAGHLVRRRSASGDDEYWLAETAATCFQIPLRQASAFNAGFFDAFPGLLTGCGLFLTFLAILFALMDVHAGANQAVTGVGQLINGLSGKFLSSVVALFLAILFTLWERRLTHGLERARDQFLDALDGICPTISAVGLLSELQQGAGDQIRSFFRDFGADLAERFRVGVSESMAPTLDRMVGLVERIGEQMRAAETARQELVTGSVERMMRELSESVSAALERMAGQFGAALTGGASTQFDKLASAVSQTAELLSGFGSHLQAMREGAQRDADAAEQRRRELEDAVVRMSEQMRRTSNAAAADAASSAQQVMQSASALTNGTSEMLERMVGGQSVLLESIRSSAEGLSAAGREFAAMLTKLGGVNASLSHTVSEAGSFARAATDAATSARESHSALKAFAERSSSWVQGARDAEEAQKRLWSDIQKSMERYRGLFAEVEGNAGGLLKLLQQSSTSQLKSAQDAYENLIRVFDNYFASAVQKLGAAVEELSESLEDLSERTSAAAGAHG